MICELPGGTTFIIAYCPESDLKSGLFGNTELPTEIVMMMMMIMISMTIMIMVVILIIDDRFNDDR